MPRFTSTVIGIACSILSCQVNAQQTHRLYQGLTAYVNNPDGRDFDVSLDIRDLNIYAPSPREVLVKIYDPDGKPVVREVIPDDGVAAENFPGQIGGWDHELQYYSNLYAKGTVPTIRWSAWSNPKRLQTLVARSFKYAIKGGTPGVYRIVLAGERDHYVTLKIDPSLKYGVSGHTTWIHGHGDLLKRSYVYVPKDTSGIFFAIAEPDLPRTRRFKLTDQNGKVLFDGEATGSYLQTQIKIKAGEYDGTLLRFDVSSGIGDYLAKITLMQPKKGAFADYCGMGSLAVYAPDPETAMALKGGTFVEDDLVFWHPFQAKLHRWLKANPLDANDQEKEMRRQVRRVFSGFRLFETSDGRGSASWTNWGYAFGYYGCKIWKTSWLLMKRKDVPEDLKAIIREGLIMGGDRLSFAVAMETVNGNAFSQINVALWYCHRATGDALQKQRFEIFWERWSTGTWWPGAGLSPSGDSQEHFSHDAHYGSYLMDNWRAKDNLWVKEGGIVGDAADDTRFAKVLDRYRNLYTYLYCREMSGAAINANPWSTRTHSHPHAQNKNWEIGPHKWKGDPGPDFTLSVNDGNEWFAARRKDYYILTFHGKLAPEWMSQCFEGQLGFSGGNMCQVTVPGKGPVIAATLHGSYGKGMHPSNWRNFHIHSVVGERWDGFPVIASISEHHNARLAGNKVTGSGEVRDAHIRVARSYTYLPDRIKCEVQLAESDYASVMSIWAHQRKWSELKVAYEMIPYMPKSPDGKMKTAITANGAPVTSEGVTTQAIRIDRGGFGLDIKLDRPRKVLLGARSTVLIELAAGVRPTPASKISISYELIPFRAP